MHTQYQAGFRQLVALLFLIISPMLYAETFNATFIDNSTNQPIDNLRVVAKEINEDGSLKWAQRRTTDASGNAEFDLKFDANQTYLFELRAFNKFTSRIGEVSSPQDLTVRVGQLVFNIVDGTQSSQPSLPAHNVRLQQQQNDGSFKQIANLNTDQAGLLKLDLPEGVYRLRAKSVMSNKWVESEDFENTSPITFAVGELPVNLQLVHAQTGAPIANQEIKGWRLQQDGRKWLGKRTTDAAGRLTWEMQGLSEGDSFVLETNHFGTTTAKTTITQAGANQWEIGQYGITVQDGTAAEPAPLTGHKVVLHRLEGDRLKGVKSMNTDNNGQVFFDIEDAENTGPYVLTSNSPTDNKTRYELPLNSSGAQTFVVGSTPVSVTLAHARTGQVFTDQRVWLKKWDNAEQKFKSFRSAKTDAQGRVAFDVADIDGKTQFQLEARPINNFRIYSETFTQPGEFSLTAGKVQVAVKDGSQASQPGLANVRVQVRLHNTETDKSRSFANSTTNASGILELDLPTPPAGQNYVLRAQSPTNNKWRTSSAIQTSGDFEFVVGNPAVNVTVVDSATNGVAADLWVSAQQQDENGDWKSVAGARTNEAGTAVFDLDGITQQQMYRFRAKKYKGNVYSEVISSPGDIELQVGQLPVTLLEKESGTRLANVRIVALELINGELKWRTAGTTDANGEVVFDVPDLGESTYVLRADKPFPDVRRIHSQYVRNAGAFEFAVSPDDDTGIDTEAPTILIHAPETDEVANQGFILAGIAQDDKQLESVLLQVWDNAGNFNEFSVTPTANGAWSGLIQPEWLVVDSQINIAATAFDRMGNSATANRFLTVVEDTTAPEITVLSHEDNDTVSQTGFSVFGQASDNIQVQSLTVTVSDTELGNLLTDKPLSLDNETGEWALYLDSELLTTASQLSFTFNVADSSNNVTEANLELVAQAVSPGIKQLVHRATFGATPNLESKITQMGTEAWINQQLAPDTIDDSELEGRLANHPLESLNDLRQRELIYQIHSKRQLQQVMAWFWENHFSTDYNSHRQVSYEEQENRLFREHALGNFSDLVEISAKSPAMLRYLDNVSSRAGRINENYARELMELHTLGVDGGYTEEDIIALARILTGWHIVDDEFAFTASRHDNENKFFLGEQVIAGGIEEGEETLLRLSRHPSTASFICEKLIHFWVNEDEHSALQSSCAASFLATEGDIPSVLRVIFSSDEFNSEANIASKVKTPLELYVSAMRATEADADLNEGIRILAAMGMSQFTYPAPDGFGDKGADWINVDAMIQRTKFALRLAFEDDGGEIDLLSHLQEQGITSPEAIIDYLFNLLLTVSHEDLERQQALAILNEDEDFSINSNDAQIKLQRLLATLLSYPGFQYQ